MKMSKGKTKRILLGLMLCGFVCNTAYATDGQLTTGSETLTGDTTITVDGYGTNSAALNTGSGSLTVEGGSLELTTSLTSDGSVPELTHATYVTTGSITLTGTDLSVSNFYYGLDVQDSGKIEITNGSTSFENNEFSVRALDGGAITINSSSVSFTGGTGAEIMAEGTGSIEITADTITFNGSDQAINTKDGAASVTLQGDEITFKDMGQAAITTAGDDDTVTLTGKDGGQTAKITFDNAGSNGAIDLQGSSTVSITADTVEFTNNSSGYGIYGEGGSADITANTVNFDGLKEGINSGSADSTITVKAGTLTMKNAGQYLANATNGTIEITADNADLDGAFMKTNGTLNLSYDAGNWNMTKDSTVSDLSLGGSAVLTFAESSDFLKLYADNMTSASGSKIIMNINGTALDKSDHIYISGTHEGSSAIQLQNNAQNLTSDVIGTKLVSVGTENGSFTAAGVYEGSTQYYTYTIDNVNTADGDKNIGDTGKTVKTTDGYGTDWYLSGYEDADSGDGDGNGGDTGPGPAQPNPGDGGNNGNTSTVSGIIDARAVNYYAFREQDKLLRRMGELRNNGEEEQGIWVRVDAAKVGRDGMFSNRYTHYQVGNDSLRKNDHREKRYEGFALSYTDGTADFKHTSGGGKNNNEEVSFYRVDQYKHGHYLDLIAKIGLYDSHFHVNTSNSERVHGKSTNYGVSMSAEYGKKNMFKSEEPKWYWEPQAQVTLGHLSGSDYTTSNKVDVHEGSINSAVGRAGFNIGSDFTDKEGRKGIFYLKANIYHEFLGSYGIDMVPDSGSALSRHGNFRDTWFEYGLGVAYQYGKNHFIYADFEKSTGGDYYKNWAWNVGLRWTFN